jgi:hypothetical protein
MHPSTQVLKYSGTKEGERGDGGNGETTEGEARSEKRGARRGTECTLVLKYSSTQVLKKGNVETAGMGKRPRGKRGAKSEERSEKREEGNGGMKGNAGRKKGWSLWTIPESNRFTVG